MVGRVSMISLTICLVILVTGFGGAAVAQEAVRPSYKVLVRRSDEFSIGFKLSVERRLSTVTEMERLICELAEAEDLSRYHTISISVYYGLDEYIEPIIIDAGEDANEKLYSERYSGSYGWTRGFPELSGIWVSKDWLGRRTPGRHPFDHTTDCKTKAK